jgi:multiple sugar transport system permease protein
MKKLSWQTVALYGLLLILALVYLIPYYIIARNALMIQREIAAFDWIIWPNQMH